MAFIQQDANGKTIAMVLCGIPNPPNGEWLEVPDDDPRCVVEMPVQIPLDPVSKLQAFLLANPNVMVLLK